jgi:hypothetical protein
MNNFLEGLTEADIRARSSEASFKRGQSYYTGGAIKHRLRHEASLEAQVSGTQTYRVTVWVAADRVKATCTCPYDQGGDCKHIVATLLAWVHEPESFQPPVDLKAVLNRRSKVELIDLLLDIFTIYPNLADDLEVVTGPDDRKLEEKVSELFNNMQPRGHLTKEQVEVHLRLMAHRAEQLAQRGQTDLARRVYYALVLGCVNLCRNYGSYDFFSASIPYDFAVAYDDLAAKQVAEQGAPIKAELDELYRDLDDPDQLGLNEALGNTWWELMEYKFVQGEKSA